MAKAKKVKLRGPVKPVIDTKDALIISLKDFFEEIGFDIHPLEVEFAMPQALGMVQAANMKTEGFQLKIFGYYWICNIKLVGNFLTVEPCYGETVSLDIADPDSFDPDDVIMYVILVWIAEDDRVSSRQNRYMSMDESSDGAVPLMM